MFFRARVWRRAIRLGSDESSPYSFVLGKYLDGKIVPADIDMGNSSFFKCNRMTADGTYLKVSRDFEILGPHFALAKFQVLFTFLNM